MSIEKMIIKVEERSRLEAIYWAGVLVWAGLVLGADSTGLLPQIGSADAWTFVFFGAGLYGTLMNIYSSLLPGSVTTTWDFLWSGFWLAIGVSGLFAVDIFWSAVFLVVGLIVLSNATRRG